MVQFLLYFFSAEVESIQDIPTTDPEFVFNTELFIELYNSYIT